MKLLSVSSSSNRTSKRIDSILLCTETRNVRGAKCCAILRISVLDFKGSRRRRPLVRSEGWVLNFQRRSKTSKRNRRRAKTSSSFFIEKDSAGMDKVLADVHVSYTMDSAVNFHRLSLIFFSLAFFDFGKSPF
jgi:hypothetical protein